MSSPQSTMHLFLGLVPLLDFLHVWELIRMVLLYVLEEVFKLLHLVYLTINPIMLFLQGLQL